MVASTVGSPGRKDKSAFERDLEAKLVDRQERFSFIERKIKQASEQRNVQISEQLQRSMLHATSSLEALKGHLSVLTNADDESWEAQRMVVESAWDDVSQAIKKVVARIP